MAWFSRLTRFGDVHWVFGQENTVACGIACAIMAAYKINKLRPGVRSSFSEADVISRATAILGPNPLAGGGLNNPGLVSVLNDTQLGMPGWFLVNAGAGSVVSQLISAVGVSEGFGPTLLCRPVIVGIDWTGGGGHWVLVDSIRTSGGEKYATVCDPWDADVHVVKLNETTGAFAYTGQEQPHLDFWGTHHSYNAPSAGGCFVGDVVRRVVLW